MTDKALVNNLMTSTDPQSLSSFTPINAAARFNTWLYDLTRYCQSINPEDTQYVQRYAFPKISQDITDLFIEHYPEAAKATEGLQKLGHILLHASINGDKQSTDNILSWINDVPKMLESRIDILLRQTPK